MQTWVETFAAAAGAFLFVLVCVLLLVFNAVFDWGEWIRMIAKAAESSTK